MALNVAALRTSITVSRLNAQAQQLGQRNRDLNAEVARLSAPGPVTRMANHYHMVQADDRPARYLHLRPTPPPRTAADGAVKALGDHRLRLILRAHDGRVRGRDRCAPSRCRAFDGPALAARASRRCRSNRPARPARHHLLGRRPAACPGAAGQLTIVANQPRSNVVDTAASSRSRSATATCTSRTRNGRREEGEGVRPPPAPCARALSGRGEASARRSERHEPLRLRAPPAAAAGGREDPRQPPRRGADRGAGRAPVLPLRRSPRRCSATPTSTPAARTAAASSSTWTDYLKGQTGTPGHRQRSVRTGAGDGHGEAGPRRPRRPPDPAHAGAGGGPVGCSPRRCGGRAPGTARRS